jgi:integrase
MGRPRKHTDGPKLEKRVYWHHAQYVYRHRDGRQEGLGTDVQKANERAKIYNDPDRRFGTIAYYVDVYISEAKAGRLHRKKSPRTIRDYDDQARFIKAGLGKLTPYQPVDQPSLLADYRDARTREAPVRANRELSLLSAMYSWLIEKGHCPGLKVNPAGLIERNAESPKDRYVEDAEYWAVYAISQRSVCMAMEMVYRTLQRPARVLAASAAQARTKTVAGVATRVLAFEAAKRGHGVDIEITAELDAALHMLTRPGDELGQQQLSASVIRVLPTLVHDLAGQPYTVDGIGAMLRRYCGKVGVKTFGLMDVRAKGATDMYLRGVPLERIQRLMGHKSVQTTEIYNTRLLQTVTIAQPNNGTIGR